MFDAQYSFQVGIFNGLAELIENIPSKFQLNESLFSHCLNRIMFEAMAIDQEDVIIELSPNEYRTLIHATK